MPQVSPSAANESALLSNPQNFLHHFPPRRLIQFEGNLLGPTKVNSGRAEHLLMQCRGAIWLFPVNQYIPNTRSNPMKTCNLLFASLVSSLVLLTQA